MVVQKALHDYSNVSSRSCRSNGTRKKHILLPSSKFNNNNSNKSKLLISYKSLIIVILLTALLHTHISSNLLLKSSKNTIGINNEIAGVDATTTTATTNSMGLLNPTMRKQQQRIRKQQVKEQQQQQQLLLTTANALDTTNSKMARAAVDGNSTLSSQALRLSTPYEPYRKWAYVYLIGGVHPKKPYYRGYLYNILVSKYILEINNSTADVIVIVQMSSEAKHLNRLPEADAKLLRAMDIKIQYLPRPDPLEDDFYHLQLSKFQILSLTNYSRAFFLDADVMPFCNTDYIFELSEPDIVKLQQERQQAQVSQSSSTTHKPILKENVILAWKANPAAGSYFMLKPGPKEMEELNMVIERHEMEARELPYPYFDEKRGWGHEIKPPGKGEKSRLTNSSKGNNQSYE